MSTIAHELAQAQRRADIAHHKNRVKWLESESPKWSCGTPVSASQRHSLLAASKGYLLHPGSGMNHCHCEPRCGWEREIHSIQAPAINASVVF